MSISESESLRILSLEHLKASLRIPSPVPPDPPDQAHDDYLKRIIVDAVAYVSKSTGAEGDDLLPLRSATVSVCRDIYDGYREIKPSAAHNTWMNVYPSYKRAD